MFHSNETYASVVATSMLSGFRISGQCNSNSQENCDVVAGPPGALSKTQLVLPVVESYFIRQMHSRQI